MIPNPSALQPNGIAPEQAAAPTDQLNGGRESVVIDDPVHVRSVMVSIIAVLAVVLMLQYAQSVLIPIVIGILISYVLAPLVKNLERARIPRSIGAAVAVSVFVGGLGLGIYTLSDQIIGTISSVPEAAQRVSERLRSHRRQRGGALQKVQEAAKEIDKAAQEAAKSDDAGKGPSAATGVQQVEVVPTTFKATDYLWIGGLGLLGFAAQFVLILFLVYFFLVTGDLYKRKLVKIAGPTLTHKKITVQILDDINAQIQSFIRVQAFTSLVVAVATSAALWWFGFDQYIVWGVFAGVFNSIPYVGPLLVTAGIGVVAFLQFDDVLRTVYVCAVTFGITSLEGFLLTPWLMSRAAQMNPVAIFVGLLFWSWVWGLWGTILAVPLLMMLKAVCDHVEDLRSIGELLGE
ncbi:MAG: AI-2E family transporter [Acidobacteriota bacterium]